MPFCTKCGASVAGAFCSQCGTPAATSAGAGSPPTSAQTPSRGGSLPSIAPRKTSPIVWVLVVILGLVLLGGLAIGGFTLFVVHKAREAGISPDLWRRNPAAATARVLAAANPDIEIISENDGAGTVSVRDRKTGKITTWNLDQAKRGRFSITAEDENGKNATVEFGTGSIRKLPSWVPSYPGIDPQATFAITGNSSDGAGGTFSFNTSDSAADVITFYQDKIKDLGMKVQVNTTTPQGGVITAADDADKRTLNVLIGHDSGKTSVNVTYGAK
jgi:hypothetical protein